MRVVCSIVLFCWTAWPIFAGTEEEIIRLQSDVLQLQNQIRVLQKNLDEKNGRILSLLEQLNDQSAETNLTFGDLVSAVTASRAQTSSLVQTVEAVQSEVQALSAKLDDANSRVASLHRKLEENQMQVETLRTPPATGGNVEPDRVYSATFNDYLFGNYALAVDGFRDFLSNYPDSEYADNAAYYLGDSYYKQGKHELAIQAFEQVINLYPKGDKTPVAYYKKAIAQRRLQRLEDAIETLEQLRRVFPDSQEANLAEAELQDLGIN